MLGEREFFVGVLSYADIGFYAATFMATLVGVPFSDSEPRLSAWRNRMAKRDSVKRVAGRMLEFLREQGLTPPNVGLDTGD